MKYPNLICGIVLIMSAIFWAIPQQIFATDIDYQTISTWDSKKIIKIFPEKIYQKWRDNFICENNNLLENTTLSLVKEILRKDVWEYNFKTLPLDVSINLVTQAFDISKILVTGDVSGIIDKIEKESVKVAVNYLIDYFNKDKVKVSFGAIEYQNETSYGKTDTTIQYIILLKDIGNNKSEVVMRLFSSEKIYPPKNHKGIGQSMIFINSLEDGESIPPFIMEVKGEIKKTDMGEYTWDKNPNIEVAFPNNVPDFNLRPPSFFERYFLDPIKEKISDMGDILDIFGKNSEFIEILSSGDEDKEAIDNQIIEMSGEKKVPVVCSKDFSGKPLHEVIINEVAWMGTKDSANNEWIELKNVSGKDISLRGWKLVDKASQIDITFGDIIMRKDSILLLERGNDNVVSSKKADLIYSGALSNTDEKLYLFNSNCSLEDYVSAESKWPAGDNSTKRTMERGSDLSWHEYFGDGYNNVWGTPREENSVEIVKEVIKEEGEEEELKEIEEEEEVKKKEIIEEKVKEITYCSQTGTPSHKDIIINEVAWMGTKDSANNEWIELRNLSSSTINLNGWQLLDKGNQIKIIFDENDIILPNQFYLLERGSDDVIPSIIADKIYSGALSNTNESLRLFDSKCNLIDEVLAEPSWPAGDNINKKTMERNNDLSWYSQSNSGTPKSTNSYFVQSYTGGGSGSVVTAPQEVEEITYCSQTGIPNHKDIIINEVAWMGDDISFSNEWIELKNISEEEINLEGWQLLSKDNKIKIVFDENDIILPNNFLLLKRGDDESDKKYSGALSNTNESLRLFDNNCNLIDEVLAEPSWPAGDNDTKKTMERGSDLSWHTYFGEFLGTPKAENSIQEEIIDDVIEEDNINDFLVISEIQTNGIDGLEYVELFNQSDEEIELCNEESCYYLAYFSTSKDEEGNYNYDWNNPYYKWDFPLGETIPPKSYYLILVHGNIENNFVVSKKDGSPYTSQLLNNSEGSIGIFLDSNQEELSVELAKELKIDVVAWGDNDFPVKEEKSLVIGNNNESFGRKLNGEIYKDTNNNFNDFELQEQSPGAKAKFPPQKIEDIQITGLSNSITLTWATPEDDDSLPEDINYEVRFSLISEGDFNVLDDANIENIDGLNVLELDNLYYDKDYCFIIQAIDSDNNKSEFSDKVSFKTFPSHHKISSIYSKSNFSNSINNFLSEDIIMENNLEIMSSPLLIDENDKIYFSARKSGARHIFSMEGNEIMWSYKCEKFCNIMSLGEDGTIYLHDSYSIKALSPKGELKWKKDGLGEISGGTFTIDSSGKIYFVANLSGNYKIYSIEDKFSEPLSNIVYSFAPKENLQSLTIDSNDNLYFSIINRLIKINLPSNAISEKIIDVDYHDEYEEEKDKITRIKKIKITPDDKILISVDHQYFNKDNKEYDSLILFSEGVNNILWKKISNGNIINIDNNQIYLWQNDSISDTPSVIFGLYGLSIEDGSTLWHKKWVNSGSSHIDQLETDNNGNVYFNKGTFFMGYNTNNITSEKPEDDLILNEPLKANIYSFSIIDSKVFFSLPLKIVLKNY